MVIQIGDIYKVKDFVENLYYFRITNVTKNPYAYLKLGASNLTDVSSNELGTKIISNHHILQKQIVLERKFAQRFKSDKLLLTYLKLIEKSI